MSFSPRPRLREVRGAPRRFLRWTDRQKHFQSTNALLLRIKFKTVRSRAWSRATTVPTSWCFEYQAFIQPRHRHSLHSPVWQALEGYPNARSPDQECCRTFEGRRLYKMSRFWENDLQHVSRRRDRYRAQGRRFARSLWGPGRSFSQAI